MNKLIVYIVFIVALTNANKRLPKKSVHLINHVGLNDQWSDFKLKYNKKYINSVEETYRYVNIYTFYNQYMSYILLYYYYIRKNIFNESIAKINEYNKDYNDGNISHISGINKFSDWVNII